MFRLSSKNYNQIIYNPKYYNIYHQVSFAVLLKTKFLLALDSAIFKLQIDRIRINYVTRKLTLTTAIDKLGLRGQAPFIKIYSNPSLTTEVGHAIAQVHSAHCSDPGLSPGQVMCDLCWTKWHWARFSLSTLVFPTSSHFHRLLHAHHLSSGAGTVGQLVANVPSGLSLTPPQEEPRSYVLENHHA
jgi:hypothetical protein